MGATRSQVRDLVHNEKKFTRMVPLIHELLLTDEINVASLSDIISNITQEAINRHVRLPGKLIRRIKVWREYCIQPLAAGADAPCEWEDDKGFFRLSLEQQCAFFSDSVGGRNRPGRPALQDLLSVPSSAHQPGRTSRKRQSDREREAITPTTAAVAAQRHSANRRGGQHSGPCPLRTVSPGRPDRVMT